MDFLKNLVTKAKTTLGIQPSSFTGIAPAVINTATNLAKNVLGNNQTLSKAATPTFTPTQTFGQSTINQPTAVAQPVVQPVTQPQPTFNQPQTFNQPTQYTQPQTQPVFNVDTSNITSDLLKEGTTKNDVYNYQTQLQNMFNEYMKYQQPLQNQYVSQTSFSPEYQKAQENLLATDLGYTQGIQDIMSKPIGMDFQQGQAAALTRDAAIKQKAAAAVANYYENLRQNQLAGTQAMLGFNTDQFNNQLAITNAIQGYQNQQASLNKPMTLSAGESVFNPMTGKVEYTAPQKPDVLSQTQINSTVNSIAGAFDNEPIVKNYNTVQEGYQTINKIGTQTKSPADDISFIYAFAKIMDPNSVVREGEYNTIQKYAQTWADNFGFNAKRIFSNTNFLTPEAKQNMLNTLKPKVETITGQYKNLASEYQRQIEDAYSGKPRQITNYSTGYTGPNTGVIQTKVGVINTNW